MVSVSILDQNYTIKTTWSDVTIRDMIPVQEYISNMPEWLKNYIYSDSDEPVSQQKLLEFYIDWISLFSDIPREYLESEIEVTETNDVSLVELFGTVAKFLGEPSQDDLGESKTITHNGIDYHLIKSVMTSGGVEKMLGGATFRHFSESQALATLFQKKQYRKWEYLAKITAILFREEEDELYNEDKVKLRSDIFKSLPVSEAYRGYFFLESHMQELQKSMLTSLTERKERQQEQQVKQSLKTYTGKLKPISWLKRVFSTNKG